MMRLMSSDVCSVCKNKLEYPFKSSICCPRRKICQVCADRSRRCVFCESTNPVYNLHGSWTPDLFCVVCQDLIPSDNYVRLGCKHYNCAPCWQGYAMVVKRLECMICRSVEPGIIEIITPSSSRSVDLPTIEEAPAANEPCRDDRPAAVGEEEIEIIEYPENNNEDEVVDDVDVEVPEEVEMDDQVGEEVPAEMEEQEMELPQEQMDMPVDALVEVDAPVHAYVANPLPEAAVFSREDADRYLDRRMRAKLELDDEERNRLINILQQCLVPHGKSCPICGKPGRDRYQVKRHLYCIHHITMPGFEPRADRRHPY